MGGQLLWSEGQWTGSFAVPEPQAVKVPFMSMFWTSRMPQALLQLLEMTEKKGQALV